MTQEIKFSDEQDLADFIRRREDPVHIVGGGTRGLDLNYDRLDTSALCGVVEYEPGALTMVAKAGTPLSEIEATLAREGQQLAFEPIVLNSVLGTKGASTIGGVFASNASGARRIQAGAARDFLLGVRYVDGHGNIIKNGGRVMKNVTGYDIVKLMAGSWGTLGIVTEVAFKVLPMPTQQATLVISNIDANDAVDAMTASLNTPFDVNGATYDIAARCAYIRIEGFEKSVDYRVQSLVDAMGQASAIDVCKGADSAKIWADIRHLKAISGRGDHLWKISVRPTDGPQIVSNLGLNSGILDWSGGLIWATLEKGKQASAILGDIAGHAMNISQRSETNFQSLNPEIAKLQKALKAKFDPKDLFNSGLMR